MFSFFGYQLVTILTSFVTIAAVASFLTPKIEISEIVALSYDEESLPKFSVKVLNSRKTRDAFDIRAELVRLRLEARGSGHERKTRRFSLVRSDPIYIERVAADDNRCNFIFTTTTEDKKNLEMIAEFLSGNHDVQLEFRIVASDGWSRVKRTFRRRFSERNQVVEGKFEYGRSLSSVKISEI